eukprot:GHVS01075043.1.p1 GENE.GHVS01075043.1~~GHVS01075043.1.p1  ORF type:complete len:488 (-),score=94.64 GHVS01075043.1:264-1727(-)
MSSVSHLFSFSSVCQCPAVISSALRYHVARAKTWSRGKALLCCTESGRKRGASYPLSRAIHNSAAPTKSTTPDAMLGRRGWWRFVSSAVATKRNVRGSEVEEERKDHRGEEWEVPHITTTTTANNNKSHMHFSTANISSATITTGVISGSILAGRSSTTSSSSCSSSSVSSKTEEHSSSSLESTPSTSSTSMSADTETYQTAAPPPNVKEQEKAPDDVSRGKASTASDTEAEEARTGPTCSTATASNNSSTCSTSSDTRGNAICSAEPGGEGRQEGPAIASAGVYVMALPHMGEWITEGSVFKWNKEVGEMVEADEVVCVIETDKVTVDIHSDVKGVVKSLGAPEGGAVLVGGTLITLDTDGFPSIPPSGKSGFRAAMLSVEVGAGGSAGSVTRVRTRSGIKFGRDHKGAERKGNGGKKGERVYSDYSEVPPECRPKGLSSAEIDFINSGGADVLPITMGGQWSTTTIFTPKKDAVVTCGPAGQKGR